MKKINAAKTSYKCWLPSLFCIGLAALVSQPALAITAGNMASSITGTFTSLGNMITAGSYIAGLAFQSVHYEIPTAQR